jgi:hypothetical protein
VIVCTADTRFLANNAAWLSQHSEGTIAKPFHLDELPALFERVLEEHSPSGPCLCAGPRPQAHGGMRSGSERHEHTRRMRLRARAGT